MPRSNARLLCTFSFRPFSIVFNGFLELFYRSSAVEYDERRQKRDAIEKCSDFPAQGYVDSNGYVLGKLEKSVGTIDFSKNRPTDGSSQKPATGDSQRCLHWGLRIGCQRFADTSKHIVSIRLGLFTRLGDYGDDSIWPSSSKVDQDRRGD